MRRDCFDARHAQLVPRLAVQQQVDHLVVGAVPPRVSSGDQNGARAEIANHARRTVRLRDGLIESDDGGFGGIDNLPVEDPLPANAAVY